MGAGGSESLPRTGRVWLKAVSLLVPSSRRDEWLAEWEAELWELRNRAGKAPGRYARGTELRYLLGAPWSALHEFEEEWMRDLWQDVRYGARTLARSPGFLAVAVLTLALGIGANTTVFTLVNGLLLREPPGISEPERLVRIGRGHTRFDNWSYPVYLDFRDRSDWFSGVAGFASAGSVILGRGLNATAVPAQLVTDNYFDVLGVRPALGREFVPEETAAPGAGPVLVISHDLWRIHFGADPSAIGQTLAINGIDYEVVGVAPRDFRGSDVLRAPASVWIPVSMVAAVLGPGLDRLLHGRQSSWFWVFARLAPAVSFDRAEAATTALYAAFDVENPDLAGQGVHVSPGVGLTPDERADTRRLGMLLLGIVLLVLLIACANLAGLALARGAGRQVEVGVRTALGASRIRVARQFLTESLLIAFAGGGVALGLTYVVASKLHVFVPYDISIGFKPDVRVLVFGLALAVGAGVFFGLIPALAASWGDVRAVLTGGSRTVTARSTWLRRGVVAMQLALSFVLLAGTGVLLRSLYNARVVDPGFDADRVAVLTIDVGRRGAYDETAGRAFFQRLLDRAALIPGVAAVGLAAEIPVADFMSNHTPAIAGVVEDPAAPPAAPIISSQAEAGFFDAIGLELVAGRTFAEGDYGEQAEQVVVINRTLAERFFSGEDPIGKLLPFGADPDWDRPTRVIGMVGEHRNRGLRTRPWAQYWYPWQRSYRGDMTLVARAAAGDPAALLPRLAVAVESIDPGMPVLRGAVLRDLIGATLRETRMVSSLIAIFGGLALLLAAIGLYGVMAYTVARRTREMGIRIALGATRGAVLLMVLRQAAVVAALGLAVGVPAAFAGLRLLETMLFEVAPSDPVALAGAAAILTTVAALAAWVPAHRAARVEPTTALRDE